MTQIKDYKDDNGQWVRYNNINYEVHFTKAFQTWQSMKSRCIVGGSQQRRYPAYIGCTVSENFKDFQYFADWCHEQVGYGLDNYDLDKDILVPNNKIYHEDICVFVPHKLNVFLTDRRLHRGEYPIGVSLDKGKYFRATIMKFGKQKTIGTYKTVEEAHAAYCKEKKLAAVEWAYKILEEDIPVDIRVIQALLNWEIRNA